MASASLVGLIGILAPTLANLLAGIIVAQSHLYRNKYLVIAYRLVRGRRASALYVSSEGWMLRASVPSAGECFLGLPQFHIMNEKKPNVHTLPRCKQIS